MDAFNSLELDARLVSTLTALGYEEPTPIQRQAIPALLRGRDLLGQAATGTGKTAAFALPLLQGFAVEPPQAEGRRPRALVLVPTRELSMQVAEAVGRYGKELGVRALAIYGGEPIGRQIKGLKQGVDVVVATPGRALDHIRRGTLDLGSLRSVVLDEADEMLDMGFADDLEAILQAVPAERQTALFSATLPPRIARIANQHLRDPVKIQIRRELKEQASKVRQRAYVVARPHKIAALIRVLEIERPSSTVVFCRTRIDVDQLTEALNSRGERALALHGGMSQEQRDRVMKQFRGGALEMLIATDVAARGIDVSHVSHVVNFEIPASPDDYVHRIGRTARAGRDGVAITFVEPREQRLLRNFEMATQGKIDVAPIPSVADLRASRIEIMRASVHEALTAGELGAFEALLDSLTGEFELRNVALAALKVAHTAKGGDGEAQEIPAPAPSSFSPRSNFAPPFRGNGGSAGGPRAPYAERRPWSDRPPPGDRVPSSDVRPVAAGRGFDERAPEGERPPFGDRGRFGDRPAFADRGRFEDRPGFADRGRFEDRGPSGDRGRFEDRAGSGERPRGPGPAHVRPSPSWAIARLYVGAGRQDGLRPADLVGALANETGLSSKVIGHIEIEDRHSIVELPADEIDRVIETMRRASLRGQRVNVRRDTSPATSRPQFQRRAPR